MLLPPAWPMLMALRTIAPASYFQYVHPVAASSEYTDPFEPPAKTRLPTTVGWAARTVSPANANAHFSFRFGTSAAVSPGFGW